MSVANFRGAIIDYIRKNAKPVDKFSHQERLYTLTKEVGAGQSYDDDVIFAAAWLHDIGVFIGHRPEDIEALAKWDAKAYAMEKTPPVLKELGFPESKIPAVVEAIRTHLPSDRPATTEAIILRDADILEQLGAVGILRTVSKIGRDTRFHTFPDALRVLRKSVETLPALLRLETSRTLAEPRIKLLNEFLDAAVAEKCEVR